MEFYDHDHARAGCQNLAGNALNNRGNTDLYITGLRSRAKKGSPFCWTKWREIGSLFSWE